MGGIHFLLCPLTWSLWAGDYSPPDTPLSWSLPATREYSGPGSGTLGYLKMICFYLDFVILRKRLLMLCSRPYHWWKKAKLESFLYSVRIPTVCGTRANLRLRVCQANKLECPPHTFCSNSSQRDTTLKTQSHLRFTFKCSSPHLKHIFLNPVFIVTGKYFKIRKKMCINRGYRHKCLINRGLM